MPAERTIGKRRSIAGDGVAPIRGINKPGDAPAGDAGSNSPLSSDDLARLLNSEMRNRRSGMMPGVGFTRDGSGELVMRSTSESVAYDLIRTIPERLRRRVSEEALRDALGLSKFQYQLSGEIVAEGTINQFAPELRPWGECSCMLNAFAFVRSVYLFGLDAACRPDAVDATLRQGADFARQRSARGRGCFARALPQLVLGPYLDLCCLVSRTYLVVPHWSPDAARNAERSFPGERVVRGYDFFERVWDAEHPNARYLLIGAGKVGLSARREGDVVYVFDPHGTTSYSTPALVVKVRLVDLYSYLTNFTYTTSGVLWGMNFAYFLPAGRDARSLTSEDAVRAISLTYGTTDVVPYKPMHENAVEVVEEIAVGPLPDVISSATVRDFSSDAPAGREGESIGDVGATADGAHSGPGSDDPTGLLPAYHRPAKHHPRHPAHPHHPHYPHTHTLHRHPSPRPPIHSTAPSPTSRHLGKTMDGGEDDITAADVADATSSSPLGVVVVAVGFRNQYSPDLGRASSVSCLRTSLAFLRIAFSYGLESALYADSIDSALKNGREWTASSGVRRDGMCSIVQLPTRIRSHEPGGDLCCVFSRVHGECDFYTPPTTFISTQTPARNFFDGVWSTRRESYTIITVGAVGMALYRKGDDAYFFDPHGRGDVSQAFVARVPASGAYAHVAGYAGPGLYWAAAMVYFVSSGPTAATPDELISAVSRLYGASETYFQDEGVNSFKELAVTASDPPIYPSPKITPVRVGGDPPGGWPGDGDDDMSPSDLPTGSTPLPPAPSVSESRRTEYSPAPTSPSVPEPRVVTGPSDAFEPSALSRTRECGNASSAWAEAINYVDTCQPTPPAQQLNHELSLRDPAGARANGDARRGKRHRPTWTPQSSTENLSASMESIAARPTRRKQSRRGRGRPDGPGELDGPPDPPTEISGGAYDEAAAAGSVLALRHRESLTLPAHDDVDREDAPWEGSVDFQELFGHARKVDGLASEWSELSVPVSRPASASDESDPLEMYLLSVYTRVFAFLIENGTRTRPDATGAAALLVPQVAGTFPRATAFGAFVSSTSMVLSETRHHVALISAVRTENARLGGLALAKLVLVAVEVDTATDELHDDLDALEAELAGGEPRGAYEQLASGLVKSLSKHKGGLFAQTTSRRGGRTLTERVRAMCELARSREASATSLSARLAAKYAAMESAVSRMRDKMDAYDPGAAIDRAQSLVRIPTHDRAVGRTQSPKPASDAPTGPKMLSLRDDVAAVLGDAVREYYLRGALYSAKAIASDRNCGKRFRVASAAVAPLARMVKSLPAFDDDVAELCAEAGVERPAPVATSPEAALLADLLSSGEDLTTDVALGGWSAAMAEAHNAGKIDKRELDVLMRDVRQINDAAARHASSTAEMQRFGALSAAVETAWADVAAASGAGDDAIVAFDTFVRCAEDMVRQARAMETPAVASGLADADRALVSARRRDVEAMLTDVKNRSSRLHEARESLYGRLRHALRPLQGFAGLRAFPSALAAAAGDLNAPASSPAELIAAAPCDVTGQLQSDLWALFTQYRETLENPSSATASAVAGLGAPFALAVDAVMGVHARPEAVEFFAGHADAVARDLSAAVADQKSVAAAEAALTGLEAAVTAVEAAAARVGTGVAPEFAFLWSLRDRAASHLRALALAARRDEILRELNSVAFAAATAAAKARLADPAAPVDDKARQDTVISEAREAARQASTAADRLEREMAAAAAATPPAGDAAESRRAETEIVKAASAARQRAVEIDTAILEFERRRKEADDTRARKKWREDADAWLRNAEARSEFDAAELRRLRDVADALGCGGHEMRLAAARAVDVHGKQALAALDAVLQFNPYTPENMRAKTVPPVSLLRNLTWGDSFAVCAAGISALFGAVTEPVMRLLRISASIVNHSNASNGFPSYYDMMRHIEREVAMVPQLKRYMAFYVRGHEEFENARLFLDALRADVLQASGTAPYEIGRALEEITYVRGADGAREALAGGVKLVVSSEETVLKAAGELEKFDQAPFKDTAYAEYVATVVRRDRAEASDALARVRRAVSDATRRAERILRDMVDAAEAEDKDSAAGLLNLKNLLRLTPVPPYISKAVDNADSADDLVTQAALLLDRTEAAEELDPKSVEWLRQARSIIDSHPVTARIDGGGPMSQYADRIDALCALSRAVDELRGNLTSAEAAWDEAWANFARERGRADASDDGFLVAKDRAASLTAITAVVLSIRVDENYRRLPAKFTGAIDGKYHDRKVALDEFNDRIRGVETVRGRLDDVLSKIPLEFDRSSLRALLGSYDELCAQLPKWCVDGTVAYRQLIGHRLAFYDAYSAAAPSLTPYPLGPTGRKSAGGEGSPDRDLLIKFRVAAMMDDSKAVLVLREAATDVDTVSPSFLDASDVPLQYTMAYRSVGDKLAAAMCLPTGKAVRPPMARDSVAESDAVSAAVIMREILNLRLGYETAVASGFSTFSRFLRFRRPDWDAESPSMAAAELYSALIATTWTRRYGAAWSKLLFKPGARAPESDADPGDAGLGGPRPDGAKATARLDLSDVMVTLVAADPKHLASFVRLDLAGQHEYMDKTLTGLAVRAFSDRLFVTTLDVTPGRNDATPGRPIPVNADDSDPSGGALFAVRFSDWRQGQLSDSDPLKPWRGAIADESGGHSDGVAGISAAVPVPSRVLPTLTVLARMCIPPTSLSTMWTVLRPDDMVSELRSYDNLITARLDSASTIGVSTDAAASGSAAKHLARPGERPRLYEPTGSSATFALVAAPPTEAVRVNAMDIATTAVLFGAQVVIAMEVPGAYSKDSGLTLCLRLFDSRRGSGSPDPSRGVSSNLSSWGRRLIDLDPNPIENACLEAQLDRLSGLIASKPLSAAPPCMITVDAKLNPTRVLWPKRVPPRPPVIRFEADDVVSELPFLETDDEVFPKASVADKDPVFANLVGGSRVDFASDKSWYPSGFPAFKFATPDPFPYAIVGGNDTEDEEQYTEDNIFTEEFGVIAPVLPALDRNDHDDGDAGAGSGAGGARLQDDDGDGDDIPIIHPLLDDGPEREEASSPPHRHGEGTDGDGGGTDSGGAETAQARPESPTPHTHSRYPSPSPDPPAVSNSNLLLKNVSSGAPNAPHEKLPLSDSTPAPPTAERQEPTDDVWGKWLADGAHGTDETAARETGAGSERQDGASEFLSTVIGAEEECAVPSIQKPCTSNRSPIQASVSATPRKRRSARRSVLGGMRGKTTPAKHGASEKNPETPEADRQMKSGDASRTHPLETDLSSGRPTASPGGSGIRLRPSKQPGPVNTSWKYAQPASYATSSPEEPDKDPPRGEQRYGTQPFPAEPPRAATGDCRSGYREDDGGRGGRDNRDVDLGQVGRPASESTPQVPAMATPSSPVEIRDPWTEALSDDIRDGGESGTPERTVGSASPLTAWVVETEKVPSGETSGRSAEKDREGGTGRASALQRGRPAGGAIASPKRPPPSSSAGRRTVHFTPPSVCIASSTIETIYQGPDERPTEPPASPDGVGDAVSAPAAGTRTEREPEAPSPSHREEFRLQERDGVQYSYADLETAAARRRISYRYPGGRSGLGRDVSSTSRASLYPSDVIYETASNSAHGGEPADAPDENTDRCVETEWSDGVERPSPRVLSPGIGPRLDGRLASWVSRTDLTSDARTRAAVEKDDGREDPVDDRPDPERGDRPSHSPGPWELHLGWDGTPDRTGRLGNEPPTPTSSPDRPADPTPLVVTSDSLVTRHKPVVTSGRGALDALIAACKLIAYRLKRARESLAAKSEELSLDILHVIILLGKA